MRYFRIIDKGTAERAEIIEAEDEQTARNFYCSIPSDEVEIDWVERIVEEVSEDEYQQGSDD